jgi:hypothetical protein
MTDWRTVIVYPGDHVRCFLVLEQGFATSPGLSVERWLEPTDELVFWPSTELTYVRTSAMLQLRPPGEFEAVRTAREESRCREREVERLVSFRIGYGIRQNSHMGSRQAARFQ